ncbi:G-protein coupled receptor 157 isoform X2 [Pygocentrus nattereri]|uniref:G-protein coupled receptor 157 isoform X2 n=1 Tax=Pygocentrus nattereri TaxID=42514 RepID=UPI00081422D1|nr:G-protein coupled receptor 157 isoform X2 [Pygocentrus nattereri]
MADGNQTEVYVYEQVVILLSCVLSFLGSLVIICTYATWRDLRTTPRKLLVFLSVADLLSALSYFYGVLKVFNSNTKDCIAQGAISTFANTSSFFWTVAIAIYLYIFIVKSSQRLADSLVLYFHLISWGVPLSITVAALALQKIGYDASEVSVGWCWVSIQEEDHVLWMLLTGKIWEFLAYVTLPVLYILIKRHIHKAGIGNTFQGAANCVMFVLCTRPVRSRLVALLCCRGRETQSSSDALSQHTVHTNTDRANSPRAWEKEGEEED